MPYNDLTLIKAINHSCVNVNTQIQLFILLSEDIGE